MLTKRDKHRQALQPLLNAAIDSPGLLSPKELNMARFSLNMDIRTHLLDPDIAALEDYLLDHSKLPGRRANLELAWAFADEVGALCRDGEVSLRRSYIATEWLLWELMQRYPPATFGSDPDSPLQMPQLCSAIAFGEWAAAFQHIERGIEVLLELASSPLWRVREAVAMGLQRMLTTRWTSTVRRLRRRQIDLTPYEWRAVAAGLAEPDLLQTTQNALDALDLHYAALAYLRRLPATMRRHEAVRTLRQGLGYTLSVVVVAAPAAGFAQMQACAAWDDSDIRWVLRENLKKKRLSAWPDQVAALRDALT